MKDYLLVITIIRTRFKTSKTQISPVNESTAQIQRTKKCKWLVSVLQHPIIAPFLFEFVLQWIAAVLLGLVGLDASPSTALVEAAFLG